MFEASSCTPVNVCVGEFCLGVEDEPSADFGLSASWLNVLHEMQNDFRDSGEDDPNNVQFFKGTPMSCSNQPGRKCCSSGGIIDDAFNECPESAEILRDLRTAGATHYVGASCDIRILGHCYKRRLHYCTYKSKFARVFLEQYKLQVEEGWGGPYYEHCRFVTINDLAVLDMDQMDFSEVFGRVSKVVEIVHQRSPSGTICA